MSIPAPYPADTRAKGWRFELDMERARQSDTWTLAAPDARPWLLMMWATAWEQTPCGSLPNDDELIAARIGMSAKLFAKHKAILLRKWWLADDGRLYHDVLVLRVVEMLGYRRKNADRVAKFKAAKRDEHVGNALPEREQHGSNGTGTSTSTGSKEENQDPPPASLSDPPTKLPRASRRCPEGFAPSPELIAEASAPGVDVARELARFRDHTFKTARSDWPATFRNWLRDAADRAKPTAGSFMPSKQAEAAKWLKGTSLDRNFTETGDAAQLSIR